MVPASCYINDGACCGDAKHSWFTQFSIILHLDVHKNVSLQKLQTNTAQQQQKNDSEYWVFCVVHEAVNISSRRFFPFFAGIFNGIFCPVHDSANHSIIKLQRNMNTENVSIDLHFANVSMYVYMWVCVRGVCWVKMLKSLLHPMYDYVFMRRQKYQQPGLQLQRIFKLRASCRWAPRCFFSHFLRHSKNCYGNTSIAQQRQQHTHTKMNNEKFPLFSLSPSLPFSRFLRMHVHLIYSRCTGIQSRRGSFASI